jgi:hypothetical protein
MEVYDGGTEDASTWIALGRYGILIETAEKEVHDASCRGSGGVPQL